MVVCIFHLHRSSADKVVNLEWDLALGACQFNIAYNYGERVPYHLGIVSRYHTRAQYSCR